MGVQQAAGALAPLPPPPCARAIGGPRRPIKHMKKWWRVARKRCWRILKLFTTDGVVMLALCIGIASCTCGVPW